MKKVFLLAVFAASVLVVNAQSSNWQFSIGASLPGGDFKDTNKNFDLEAGDGFAATGLTLGLKYIQPLAAVEGLSWTLGADIYFNPLNSDYKEKIADMIDEAEEYYDEVGYTLPRYFNVPLTVGVNYQYSINEKTAIFAELGLGYNLSKMTNQKSWIEDDGYEESETLKLDISTAFCYRLEAGVLFNQKYSLSLKYNALGSHKYKGEYIWEDDDDDGSSKYKYDKALNISTIGLTFGVRF